ncbi:MAG: DUF58 domain-containing protein, partial [Gemmatimonadales bacterium]
MLLEPAFLSRLERLALRTRERLAGAYPGEHRSRRLGSSLDFADWRPYVEGDDFRRIDYQIYARLDRLVVRLFEAEEELLLRIVVDASASMGFEGKLAAAARLAGAMAYLAACRRDRARVFLVEAEGIRASPWVRSRDSAVALFSWLEEARAGGASRLAAGLQRLSAAGGLPGMTVVIGDLLDEEWEKSVRRLAGPGAEGAIVHLLAPSELDPTLRGDFALVDSETERPLEVSLSDQVLRSYRQRAAAWVGTVAEACRRRGVRYVRMAPDDDLETLLLVQLRREGLV